MATDNGLTTISRRRFMRLAAAGAALGTVPGCGLLSEAHTANERPNVLFIAVDDLRPELGCYGTSGAKTPHIDRLAARGMTFNRAYCQQAVCNPSRASLLTGLRPDTIRVWDLRTDFRNNLPDAVTLPQHFKQNGYHSVGIGKIYHNTLPDRLSWSEPKLHVDGYPFDPDAVYCRPENIELQEKRKAKIVAQGRAERYIDRLGQWYLKTVATECCDVPDNAYYDGAQTDVAVEKLGELATRSEPFFFGVGYYRPHLPFNAPRKYWDMYDRDEIALADNDFLPHNAPVMAINNMRELRGYSDFRNATIPHDGPLTEDRARLLRHGYLASVSYIDAQIGRLLDTLDRLGLSENTIVVLWGDHGWKLGEHRSWGKMTNYEIDTRVPLIVSAPGASAQGGASDRLVEFVDIYPTLCDLASLAIPAELEGKSFAPLLDDPHRAWKSAAFSQFLRNGIWQSPDGKDYMGRTIRTERYRYVEWSHWESGELAACELYAHATAPQENSNVAADPGYAAVVQDLAVRLAAGWRAVR